MTFDRPESLHYSVTLTLLMVILPCTGSNPDFRMIICPFGEAMKLANPHGKALIGSFSSA